jgi:acetate---CoA ligase (ADP-forming)
MSMTSPEGANPVSSDYMSGFFNAERIAVVGATDKNKFGRIGIQSLLKWGWSADRLFLINPRREEIYGQPCYPNLSEIPASIDLALLLVAAPHTQRAVEEAAAAGAKYMVTVANGFSELNDEGRLLQERVTQRAEDLGVRFVGPNCVGLADFHTRVSAWTGTGDLEGPAGSISLVSQSGGVLDQMVEALGGRYVGLRRIASVGNCAMVGVEDFLLSYALDPATEVIVAYVEAVRDSPKMIEALQICMEANKPVVMLYTGGSPTAERAIRSHTGAIVNSGSTWSKLLRQMGVVLVPDLGSMIETAVAFGMAHRRALGRRVGYISVSGGDATLGCETLDRHGFEVPEISKSVRDELGELLDREDIVANPFDLQGAINFGSVEPTDAKLMDRIDLSPGGPIDAKLLSLIAKVIDEVDWVGLRFSFAGEGFAGLVPLGELRDLAWSKGRALICLSPFIYYPAIGAERFMNGWHSAWLPEFAKLGVPMLLDAERGAIALSSLISWQELIQRRSSTALNYANNSDDDCSAHEIALAVDGALSDFGSDRKLPNELVERLLSEVGIPVLATTLAASAEEAVAAANACGYPVVIKLEGPDLLHRSKVGGVIMHVHNAEEVSDAYVRLVSHANAKEIIFNGVSVQHQASGIGELMIGCGRAQGIGPVVVVGRGGVDVENEGKIAVAYAPVSYIDATELLHFSGIVAELEAAGEGDQIVALAKIVVRASKLGAAFAAKGWEMDINPVIWGGDRDGHVAVDVLVCREVR